MRTGTLECNPWEGSACLSRSRLDTQHLAQFLATVGTQLLSFKEGMATTRFHEQGHRPHSCFPAAPSHQGVGTHTKQLRPGLSSTPKHQGRSWASTGTRGLNGDKHPHAGSRRCQLDLWLIINPAPQEVSGHAWQPQPWGLPSSGLVLSVDGSSGLRGGAGPSHR